MLATLVIALREGLEASLVVGIIAAFLRRNGAPLRALWIGVGAAVALSLAVGLGLQVVESSLPQAAQEAMESVIGAVAVVFVTTMIVWMRHHARSLRQDLEASASAALRGGATSALAVMAFLAVLKEGFETAVFLLATFSAASSAALAAVGAVTGLVVAVLIGWGIYRGGIHLDLRKFFAVTGVFLVVVAAGLTLTVLRTAHEAGWVTVGQQRTIDLTWLAPTGSVRAALVTGVLGIPADPRVIEVLAWAAYLVPVLAYVLWPARLRPSAARVPAVKAGLAGALGVAALVLAALVPGASAPDSPLPLAGGAGTVDVSGDALVVRSAGATTHLALNGAATDDDRAGLAVQRRQTQATSSPADAPASLTLDQVVTLAGGRLPVGLDPRADPGPFTATWTTTTTTTAWITDQTTHQTGDSTLVDASRSARTLVSLAGGGLSSPRVLTVTPAGATALGLADDPATWHVTSRAAADRAAALADLPSRAAESAQWRRDVPLVLFVAAALLLASAGRERRRLQRRDAPVAGPLARSAGRPVPGAVPSTSRS